MYGINAYTIMCMSIYVALRQPILLNGLSVQKNGLKITHKAFRSPNLGNLKNVPNFCYFLFWKRLQMCCSKPTLRVCLAAFEKMVHIRLSLFRCLAIIFIPRTKHGQYRI